MEKSAKPKVTVATESVTFHTKLKSTGKNTTGIEVPPKVVEKLGKGKKPPVQVTVNGYAYRSTVAVRDSVYLVPVSAEIRAAAGFAAGDALEVRLTLDTTPREVEVPADFAAALKTEPVAYERFGTLSYSNKQRHVLAIEGAKTAETRQRRINKSIEALKE